MDKIKINKVYIISGPAGVGKSTVSKALAKKIENSAYISGDSVSSMHVNGRKNPWESTKEVALIWDNILSLTKNFLKYKNNVVIDYVTFLEEAEWINASLRKLNVEVNYIVLWADNKTLANRDNMRKSEYRMGERCLILADEFREAQIDQKHILDTSHSPSVTSIVNEILNSSKYTMT